MTRSWQFVATRIRLIANPLSDATVNVAVQPAHAGSSGEDEDAATISDVSEDCIASFHEEGSERVRPWRCKELKGAGGRAAMKSSAKGKEKANEDADEEGVMVMDEY
jgi:hypothetical protein